MLYQLAVARFNKRISKLQTKKCDHAISLSILSKNQEAHRVCDENEKKQLPEQNIIDGRKEFIRLR